MQVSITFYVNFHQISLRNTTIFRQQGRHSSNPQHELYEYISKKRSSPNES